jgi:CubicO group peptidase (beta-lactamase class C family)
MLLIRLAAWQPLLFTPGTRYHHSKIGWNIAGLMVEPTVRSSQIAADEATFLRALVDDELHVRDAFLFFVHPSGWTPAEGGCPGNPIEGVGTGDASRSYVYYSTTGDRFRIAVLLLNGDRAATRADDPKTEAAAASLYCGT